MKCKCCALTNIPAISSTVAPWFSCIIHSTSVLMSGVFIVWSWPVQAAWAKLTLHFSISCPTHSPAEATQTSPCCLFIMQRIYGCFSYSLPKNQITTPSSFPCFQGSRFGLPTYLKNSSSIITHVSKVREPNISVLQLFTTQFRIFLAKLQLLHDSASY